MYGCEAEVTQQDMGETENTCTLRFYSARIFSGVNPTWSHLAISKRLISSKGFEDQEEEGDTPPSPPSYLWPNG